MLQPFKVYVDLQKQLTGIQQFLILIVDGALQGSNGKCFDTLLTSRELYFQKECTVVRMKS